MILESAIALPASHWNWCSNGIENKFFLCFLKKSGKFSDRNYMALFFYHL